MKDNKIVFSKPSQGIPYLASTILSHKIDLEKASYMLKNAMYESEQFPGLIYRGVPKVVILLFESWKLVCSGASKQDICRAIRELHASLKLNALMEYEA